MTGKELILYILQNDLEHELVLKNNIFIGIEDDHTAAMNFNVGTATVRVWRKLGLLRNNQTKKEE